MLSTVVMMLLPLVLSASQADRTNSFTDPTAFDTVSIRRNSGDDEPSGLYSNGYRAVNLPLWRTIEYGYFPTQNQQKSWIFNAPNWIFEERFDVFAKIAQGQEKAWQNLKKTSATTENLQFQMMFRQMLCDRLNLKIHRKKVEVDGYTLTVKTFPNHPVTAPHSKITEDIASEPQSDEILPFENAQGHGWDFRNISMRRLLAFLSMFSDGPLQDGTHLEGRYNLTLQISNETSGSQSNSDTLDDFFSIQRSLERQGLQLRKTKVSINALVIDHIDRPSEN